MFKCKLGELLAVKHGYAFKSENYVEKSEYGLVTLANISNSNDFKFNESKTTYYGGDFPEEFILEEDDLVMPLTEQVIGLFGNTAFIPKVKEVSHFVLNQRVGKVIPKNKKADKYYLHYLLATEGVKNQLEYRASGTRQRNISPDDIYDVDVFIPEIESQVKIGKTLYELEKKINNNNKINAELESMAKTIYDYWFLQFDFPDENGKPYKSSGGEMFWNEKLKREIPKEWEIKKIEEILDKIPKRKKYKSNEYKLGSKYPIVDQSSEYICGYTDDESELLELDDCIIFGDHTKYVKYINFPFARGADGTQVINSSDVNLPNYLLYRQILDMDLVSQGYSRYFKFLKDKYVIIPNQDISVKYMKTMKDILIKMRCIITENKELISLRDFLLPLLMNGQVGFKFQERGLTPPSLEGIRF